VLLGIAEMEKKYGLRCANVFHAGDGNLHPLILFDANIADEFHRAELFGAEILELCVEVGGTITGEHGVGIEKINSMCVQFSPAEREAFFKLKRAFDPPSCSIRTRPFPPCIAVPSTARCTCSAASCASRSAEILTMQAQQDMEAVLASFRERILSGRALQIRGGGTKDWYGQVPAATCSTRAPTAASSTTNRPSWSSPPAAARRWRDRRRAGRAQPDAGLRAAAFRRRRHRRRHGGRRPVRPARAAPGRCATSCWAPC
jgi:hypothetical protein